LLRGRGHPGRARARRRGAAVAHPWRHGAGGDRHRLSHARRWPAPLQTALGTLRLPDRLEAYVRPDQTAYGQAPVSVLRFARRGRVAVLDLLRARTRRFEIVFVLGLEEGRLPRRGHESPFLADDARRELDERSRARLSRPDQVARDRYLFYTACTRATKRVYLAR